MEDWIKKDNEDRAAFRRLIDSNPAAKRAIEIASRIGSLECAARNGYYPTSVSIPTTVVNKREDGEYELCESWEQAVDIDEEALVAKAKDRIAFRRFVSDPANQNELRARTRYEMIEHDGKRIMSTSSFRYEGIRKREDGEYEFCESQTVME